MKIEILFPEICNLYGELANIKLIKESYENIEIIETSLKDKPLFMKEIPDLIYMGSVTEDNQVIVIDTLRKYGDRIYELIEEGARFLITGNAIEVFGKEIIDYDNQDVKALGIFDVVTRRDMLNRFNSLYLGKFNDMDIVGFKSQFTHSYYPEDNKIPHLFDTVRGPGLNPEVNEEGIMVNNFMATYVIGPILILNPPFAKYILKEMGIENPVLKFEKEAMEAYEIRIKEYSNPDTGFYY